MCKHPAIVGLVASIASVIAIATKSIASATRCRCAYMRYVRSTFESAVGKNEKWAAVYNTAYGTHKQPCNSSARCLFSYIHSYPCASTLLLWIYEKTTSRLFARLFFRWCRRSDSNRHGWLVHRILSPARLPVSPRRRKYEYTINARFLQLIFDFFVSENEFIFDLIKFRLILRAYIKKNTLVYLPSALYNIFNI